MIEVCQCCVAAATLDGQHSHLVLDSVLNGQPMQLTQYWLDMKSSWNLENDLGCIVLHSLQNLNTAGWSTVQHWVAVVQSGQYDTASQCNREFYRQFCRQLNCISNRLVWAERQQTGHLPDWHNYSKVKRLSHCQLSISSVTCTNHCSIQQQWADANN